MDRMMVHVDVDVLMNLVGMGRQSIETVVWILDG